MAVEWQLPDLGDGIDSATVLRVMVAAGDTIAKEQPVVEVETDKVTVEVPSSMAGTITTVHISEGDKVSKGQAIFSIEGSNAEDISAKTVAPPTSTPTEAPHRVAKPPTPQHNDFSGVRAAPAVRRLARELELDVDNIPGSGPQGQVLLDDVKECARDLLHGTQTPRTRLPDFSKWGTVAREPMTQVREKTAERMTEAWTTIPHVTQFDEADITKLEIQRKAINAQWKNEGVKLTVTAILIQVITEALKKFPKFNCSIDMNTHEVIHKQYYNIGIAVDTEAGLVVPVIKNTDTKDLQTLAKEMTELSAKARDRKLKLEDIQGGNITITNLGGIGGTNFTPIINPPEVAIVAVSRGKTIGQQLMMPLGVSYDHRIIDGADTARFLRYIAEGLESFTR